MRDWRQAYEHALGPGFSYNTGERWFGGAPRATLTTAGPHPADLVRKWDVERRRQAKVIRSLTRVKAATA